MSVKVRCTGCDKVLTAPDSARGKAIKCPACETRVRVPEASAGKSKPSRSKAEKADSEHALASLDLRNAEDHDARICVKCGYDMSHMEEEETECPKCGHDASVGGLGEKAQKRRLKGPDPDKFYSGLWKSNWKFVLKNQGLAWRSMAYLLIASALMFFCLFMYLYIPMWPPRLFFALCAFVSGMMIPGWLWFMDQEVIVATLQKKDKLKRINFDFFLCSALGVKFVCWNVVFAGPILLFPALIGLLLTMFGGMPSWVLPLMLALGYLPVLTMMPICMGHFVMPIQAPGWMFWKVTPAWLATFKPTVLWLLLTLGLAAPALACIGTAGAIYGSSIEMVARQMDENAAIGRAKRAAERASKKDLEKVQKDPLVNVDYHKPDYMVLLVPGILWGVACLLIGFPAMYSSRVNGQFIYFFRDSLDLQALAKEYKYVAKVKPDEDEEAKPKTLQQVIVESLVLTTICGIIGIVAGMVMASLSNDGNMILGMIGGGYYGACFASLMGRFALLNVAFKEGVGWGLLVLFVPFADIYYVATHWEDGASGCLTQIFGSLLALFIIILAIAGIVSGAAIGLGSDEMGGAPPPNAAAPGDAMPPADVMPAGGPVPAGVP